MSDFLRFFSTRVKARTAVMRSSEDDEKPKPDDAGGPIRRLEGSLFSVTEDDILPASDRPAPGSSRCAIDFVA